MAEILESAEMTDLQLRKIYDCLYDLKKFRRTIENHDVAAVIDRMAFYTKNGCLGASFGWSEKNSTTVWISKRGVEFDGNGSFHSFEDVAAKLIAKFG